MNDLLEGLKTNEDRYGYPSCPCRPATGVYAQDRDIICPCDYRDPDVSDYGACYCSLYVNQVIQNSGELKPIPERRPPDKMFPELAQPKPQSDSVTIPSLLTDRKLWYCKQCGYVTYRDEPPFQCPICRAKKEFFAEIRLVIQ